MFRVALFMNEDKKRILMNSFFWSQFIYCPHEWMCHNRILNNKINYLNKRCLNIVHNDRKSTYEHLLIRDKSVSVHIKILQILATQIFKVHRDLSSADFKELFNRRTLNYELRHPSQFTIPLVECVYNGFESIACLGAKI